MLYEARSYGIEAIFGNLLLHLARIHQVDLQINIWWTGKVTSCVISLKYLIVQFQDI